MCAVFLDLNKAFDVDHKILPHNLMYYGIRGKQVFFRTYLIQHCHKLNNYSSNFQKIECGVSQGSVMGPLLFLVYVDYVSVVQLQDRRPHVACR